MSWHSPENVSNLTCLNLQKLSVYPGFILYQLSDSLLVDKAYFYRILLLKTYSVNPPLTSVFFQEIKHDFFARYYEYQGFVVTIPRYFANNLHQLLMK